MIRKSILIVLFYFIFGIVFSCQNCDVARYYDFSKAEVYLVNNNIVETNRCIFHIRNLDIEYISGLFDNFNLISKAYAIDCEEGWDGMKYPVTNIEITSDSDFNEQYLANSLLNDLVTIHQLDLIGAVKIPYSANDGRIDPTQYKYMKLKDADLSNILWSDMYISDFPTISKEHLLTIKLIKSNGDIISMKSDKITWE